MEGEETLRVGQDIVRVFDEVVGRQAALGLDHVHGASRRDKAHPSSRAAWISASISPFCPRGKT